MASDSSLSPRIAVTRGSPRVKVPVLSTTSRSIFAARSSTSLFLTSNPWFAARPRPTMIDMGIARPSAQGQAIIRTLIAVTSAKDSCGGGPKNHHNAAVSSARPTTAGTKTELILSTRSAIGGFEFCASAISRIIPPRTVSLPTASALTITLLSILSVPAQTAPPVSTTTASDSPVSMD